jgi:hypothetical protein
MVPWRALSAVCLAFGEQHGTLIAPTVTPPASISQSGLDARFGLRDATSDTNQNQSFGV